jgi:hypothetical protein
VPNDDDDDDDKTANTSAIKTYNFSKVNELMFSSSMHFIGAFPKLRKATLSLLILMTG